MELVLAGVSLICVFTAVILHHIRATRRLKQWSEDVELVCDTAMRCLHIVVGHSMVGGHPRLMPDPVGEEVDYPDWDSMSVNPVPSVDEIQDTIDVFAGDTRAAVFKLMQRRGLDPDRDEDVLEWQKRVNGSI